MVKWEALSQDICRHNMASGKKHNKITEGSDRIDISWKPNYIRLGANVY